MSLSQRYHQVSKILKRLPNQEPDAWFKTYYKSYPRLPKIILSREHPPTVDFFNLIKRRRSRNDFGSGAISKTELSIILEYSCGNTGVFEDKSQRFHRAYPSAGARFSIEVYPIIFRHGPSLPAGLYHYNVKDHAVDVLWDRIFNDEEIDKLFTYQFVKKAATVIVMTAVFARAQDKYGERGYRYILLEAGHICQNIYLVSEALGLKCCAVTGTHDALLEQLLDIDGVSESIVYTVVIGR